MVSKLCFSLQVYVIVSRFIVLFINYVFHQELGKLVFCYGPFAKKGLTLIYLDFELHYWISKVWGVFGGGVKCWAHLLECSGPLNSIYMLRTIEFLSQYMPFCPSFDHSSSHLVSLSEVPCYQIWHVESQIPCNCIICLCTTQEMVQGLEAIVPQLPSTTSYLKSVT